MIAMPDLPHLRDELVASRARRGSRGSTRACRACRRCARARGRSSSRTERRTQRRSGRPRSTSCPRRRRVECLSTTLRPSAEPRSIVSPLRDHRVGERERLRAGQALEVDGHAEGGHLVVGHVAPRVARARARAARSARAPRRRAFAGSAPQHGPRAGGSARRRSAGREYRVRATCRRASDSPSRRRRRTPPS